MQPQPKKSRTRSKKKEVSKPAVEEQAVMSSEDVREYFSQPVAAAVTVDQAAEALRASISERAYQLYEKRGRQEGHDLDDWLEAEREIIRDEIQKSAGGGRGGS